MVLWNKGFITLAETEAVTAIIALERDANNAPPAAAARNRELAKAIRRRMSK